MSAHVVQTPQEKEAVTDDSAYRSLYRLATDPEGVFPDESWAQGVRAEIRRLREPGSAPADLDALRSRVTAWADGERPRYAALLGGDDGTDAVLSARASLACAPLATQDGAWLQWLISPGSADDPSALALLALFASDVGVGRPRASRGSGYVSLLREAGLAEYAVPASRLALDRRIADRDFYLPALLLAMSRMPGDFLPEILGADLCLRAVGTLPPLAAVTPSGEGGPATEPPAPGGKGGRETSDADHRWNTVRSCLDSYELDSRRVADGFTWAWSALRRWSRDLYEDLGLARDPAHTMAELLRARAREGAVYHHRYVLAGRSLSSWLTECRHDPSAFLKVLAASDLVRPGHSERSRLVNALVLQRGPMFRVFSPDDLAVIRRWIDSLPAGGAPAAGAPGAAPAPSCPVPSTLLPGGRRRAAGGTVPTDLRSAYHLLQRRPQTPALRRYTDEYVAGWLGRARHGIDRDPRAMPEVWPADGLRPWLLDQHDRHHGEFESNLDAPPPSREELIDSTVQLAPLTLIDGAWLQGFTDYELASSEHGYFLFETYWDELGNGVPGLNHPLIYRQVLDGMGVELPPTASEEFARWPGFDERSFALPVYWLCVGRYPQTYLPEVLGLNLAMELSGVGGGYRRAHTALRTYGFSTRFVDIHNTIDNVATGHSAWAADAVDAYMSSVLKTHGTDAQSAAWGRVRVGFRSLDPPDGWGARRAARRARKAASRRHTEAFRPDGVNGT
ncbi:iron-containing redox enzyme family protein [Streptomyces sp. NPDC058653]|uniref:iron-containing redox enzyme family protein n=1 Tax=Streptomyces sp. NPDC058653 TaxID=3346576 RepID=UPI003652A057